MKKFIALFLVLVMAFSCILVSCNKKDENTDEPSESDDDLGFNPFVTSGTGTGTGTGTSNLPTKTTYTEYEWTDDANGTMIYVVVDGVSVRSDTNSSKDDSNTTWRATANFGESYKRIRYNEYWTQIDYKGNQYYISSTYVTTDNGKVTFTNDEAETTVYVIAASLTLRSSTYTGEGADNAVTYVSKGVSLTRIATSANGTWIKVRVTYTPVGETAAVTKELYCKAEFVSATKDAPAATTAALLG